MLAGCAATLIAATTIGANSVASASNSTVAAKPAASRSAVSATKAIRLITGETVLRRQVSGHPVTTVIPAAGERGGLVRMSNPKQSLLIPTAALPYLGSALDPALFDISKVSSGLTVHVAAPKLASVKIPGLHVTKRTSTEITGTFDRSGSAAFGAALRKQAAADRAAHRTSTSLFGAARISVTAGPAHIVKPAFAQVTTRFAVRDRSGRPANFAMLFLLNLDNPDKFANPVMVMAGQARASLPKGRYTVFAVMSDDTSDSVVSLPLIHAKTNLQKFTIDARRATAKVSLVTPRPTAADYELTSLDVEQEVTFQGEDYLGQTYVDNGVIEFGRRDLFVAPSAAPPVGTQTVSTAFLFGNDQMSATPYSYTASYQASGAISGSQRHVVRDVATLAMSYYPSAPGVTGGISHMAVPADDAPVSTFAWSTPPGGRATDYLVSPKGMLWQDDYLPSMDLMATSMVDVQDLPRARVAGQTYPVDFLRGPLAPGLPVAAVGPATVCYSCRSDDQIFVALAPLTDSVPGHFGSVGIAPDGPTVADFKVWQDGKLIDSESNNSAIMLTMPARATTVRARLETWLRPTGFARSPHAVTDLTIRTSAADPIAPGSWDCGDDPWGEPTSCRVPAELTTSVPLPTALDSTMTVGAHPFTFSIAPIIGKAAVTATLQISLDGGRTFSNVPVTALGGNQFRAALTNSPASVGKSVTIRVSGHTADGASITQTTDSAYVVKGA
ncbi:hypothetical protein AZH51_01515 [Branchiibius sp. NY16-3462-2]|nr:hypothetical protein AZH51_01515 [Branchiibius sp. NY16-3462-2]